MLIFPTQLAREKKFSHTYKTILSGVIKLFGFQDTRVGNRFFTEGSVVVKIRLKNFQIKTINFLILKRRNMPAHFEVPEKSSGESDQV